MAITYCTAAQVNSFLGLTTAFSGSTNPTQVEVEEFIERNQDSIDKETMHAWRTLTITEETHHLQYPAYQRRDGSEIFLQHRQIQTLLNGTDKLEIWNGSVFEDYLATRVEGRNNDYWFDKRLGTIYIKTFPRILPRYFAVRVTYRYGESAVVKDIEKACVLMTAIDILGSDDRSVLLPEGTSNIGLPGKAELWQKQVDKILQNRRETILAIV